MFRIFLVKFKLFLVDLLIPGGRKKSRMVKQTWSYILE